MKSVYTTELDGIHVTISGRWQSFSISAQHRAVVPTDADDPRFSPVSIHLRATEILPSEPLEAGVRRVMRPRIGGGRIELVPATWCNWNGLEVSWTDGISNLWSWFSEGQKNLLLEICLSVDPNSPPFTIEALRTHVSLA